ncbi:LemA family protein [Granulicatella balaenopterae]|nr:LemA family protein [Granulicatella balaenopterae]
MENQKNSILLEMIKMFAVSLVGWIGWLFIFSSFTPMEHEEVVEPFTGASFVFGVITGLLLYLGMKYNKINHQYQQIKTLKSNILIAEERGDALLSKANRVVDKYMANEKELKLDAVKLAQGAGGIKFTNRIGNSNQFKMTLKDYPELRTQDSIQELLNQIKSCEDTIAVNKVTYNEGVEKYNTSIHSFPMSMFGKITKFKDASYYREDPFADLVSDEALGI